MKYRKKHRFLAGNIYYSEEADTILLCLGKSSLGLSFSRFLISEMPVHTTCEPAEELLYELIFIGRI